MGGVLRLPKNNLNLLEESFRLQIKDLAEETRIKFARKGLSDIFDILSEAAFLIRKPFFEERLMPETKAIGAAKIKGQGLATTRTSAIRTGSPEIA